MTIPAEMTRTDPFGYAGRRVVVTGCFSGIGHATARLLTEWGAEVHGLDVKATDLSLASSIAVDLRDAYSIDGAIGQLNGSIDALFNCAGIPPGAPPLDLMKVNFLGARHLTDLLAPLMRPGSAIVNVASTGGMNWRSRLTELRELDEARSFAEGQLWCEAHPDLVGEGYRCSKEAMIVWTLLNSARLIARGIRMNCTLPGAVQTPMLDEIEKVTPSAVIDAVAQPFGRRSSANEQAIALAFLGSSQASYVNGAALEVDGGFMASLAVRA